MKKAQLIIQLKKLSNLKKNKQYEIILINDNSSDHTYKILSNIKKKYKNIKIANNGRIGLGGSIELGINLSKNKYIAIMMADLSDNPNDLIRYYKIISKKKLHAVFGSRFLKNSKIKYYPIRKLIFNRIFNIFVKILFLSRYNDFTNAFKIYEKKSLFDIKPLVSENFNIFLELLKNHNEKKI